MLRLLRNIFIGIVISVVALLMVLMILGYVYQDKLKQFAIAQINENINAPIKVDGGIDITFIRNFPDVSIVLNQVSIPDMLRKKSNLIKVERVSLLFNIYEVFQDKISIRKIIIADGSLFLFTDKNGKTNFDIIKSKKDEQCGTLRLKSVYFDNIDFAWKDNGSKVLATALIHDLDFFGDFGKRNFDLKTDANFEFHDFILAQDSFPIHKKATLDFSLNIDKVNKLYTIKHSTLDVASNKFIVDVDIRKKDKSNDINIKADCNGEEIATLLELLPNQYKKQLTGISGNGKYEILFALESNKSGNFTTVSAKLNNGTLTIPKLSGKIKEVNAAVSYNSKTDVLKVTEFSSRYEDNPIQFQMEVKHLSHTPEFMLHADGDLNLKSIQQFIPEDKLQEISGNIKFSNFNLYGAFDGSKNLKPSRIDGSGSFVISDAKISANKVVYSNINGTLNYEKSHLVATNLSASFLSSDFLFDGEIDNLFAFIIQKTNRNGNIELVVDGNLSIKGFELSKMIAAFQKEQKSEAGKIDIREVFMMRGKLILTVDRFRYEKLVFDDIKAKLELSPAHIGISSLETRTMGGTLSHSGYINFTAAKELEVAGDLSINDVEIIQLFEQSDNFSQSTLTSKHLKGKIDANLSFVSFFNNYKDFDMQRLSAILNCKIKNGELINFEPIKVASKFIRVEELNHIYFSDLTNQIIIKNKVITVPQMEVQSSALNLMLNGTHNFDNDIDYHIKVNLRKLLANKFKKNFSNEYIEEDPYEGSNIFLSIAGNISKPVITYDKQFVKKKIQNDFKAEKENLKTLFKKEATQQLLKEDIKEDKYFDTREKPKYIEFEDN